jgi:signal peptidase I
MAKLDKSAAAPSSVFIEPVNIDKGEVLAQKRVEETPFEALASICSVLVVGLFILTFLAQNYRIPSGSMENTLLVGDHLVVDQITLMPPASWMPLIRYREPRRGDIVVFHKPVNQPGIDATNADGTHNTLHW